ncbi:hypothetical protein V6N12_027605 [Hibiscus sabdariffa]|uniref:Uncharacterized protein n=1 Tax=Hibiscus sabdariffa TaxID=183260 RepID=A0ABR2F3D6_9ROSI
MPTQASLGCLTSWSFTLPIPTVPKHHHKLIITGDKDSKAEHRIKSLLSAMVMIRRKEISRRKLRSSDALMLSVAIDE